MKKKHVIMLALLACTIVLQAQIHLFLEEKQVSIPDGKFEAWVFPINHNLDEALDDLKDFCKDRSDVKMKKEEDNLYMAEKISLPAISTKRGDLIGYARISEQNYAMAMIFKLGYDISVDSEHWPSEMESLRSYAKSFMTYHYESHYARIIEGLEKQIKSLEKDLKKDEGEVESLNKKIINLGKKIAKETETEKINEHEAEINTLEGDMQAIMNTLPEQESRIDELKTEVARNKTESNTYLSTIAQF